MAEGQALAYQDPTDEQAQRVGSNMLEIPKDGHNMKKRKKKYKNGYEAELTDWEQLCVIDNIEPSNEMDTDLGVVRQRARIQLRISDKVKQLNQGRVESDFCNFWWDLSDYSDEQLEEWFKKSQAPNASSEDQQKGKYRSAMFQMNMASQRMAQLLKALGHEDKLANRSVFRGLGKIKDVIPRMIGKQIVVRLRGGDDKEGVLRVNIMGYKKA